MAAVDAYAPCPCGSGQKYKRCCQKAETYVDRAERLDRNGQHEAAVSVLNEGLTKLPDSPLLYIRKAVSLLSLEQPERAMETVEELLKRQPDHFGANVFYFRILLELGDVEAAIEQFQATFGRADAEARPKFASLAAMLGGVLARAGQAAAAIKHLELARALGGPDDSWVESSLSQVRSLPSFSAWVKNPYRLSGPPDGLSDEARGRFDEAVGWAEQGLWMRAASAFELLSADRNLGLCRLWLGDRKGAVEALRRSIENAPPSADAVDLEALCQSIDDAVGGDPVEEVELSWPIRDRDGLLDRLAADPRCVATAADEDHDEPDRPTGAFLLLDRPKIETARPDLKPSELPRIVGRILAGTDAVTLQTRDDGRLDQTIDAFTAAADKTIPPAHPRTKVIGAVSRVDHVLDVLCFPPTDLPPADRQRLTTALLAEHVGDLWPETPMPFLADKTPLQAAAAGGFEVPLRAALALIEESGRDWDAQPDWAELRARLKLPAEPPIDHASVVIGELPLGRLGMLDPKRLDDDRLLALYERSKEWGLPETIVAAARELTTRRKLLERDRFPVFSIYGELTMDEVARRRREPALEWARKGRAADPQARRSVGAASWDMLELQVRMATDEPEAWVPELVVVMNRYEGDQDATRLVLSRLVQAGLVRLAPLEDGSDRMTVDSSLLQNLISRYGPRVQTASGEVGVAAARGGIWTPGGGTAAAGEKPRIILPGR